MSAIAPRARVRCVALVQWITVWRCCLPQRALGDADVGSDACRIEMYLYNFVYLVVIWEGMVWIAVVGVGVRHAMAYECNYTCSAYTLLCHSRPSLGQRLERTMAAVTVTLVQTSEQSFKARLSVTAQKQEEELPKNSTPNVAASRLHDGRHAKRNNLPVAVALTCSGLKQDDVGNRIKS